MGSDWHRLKIDRGCGGMGKLIELRCPKCRSVAASKTEFRCPGCHLVREAVVAIDHLSRDDFARLRQSRDRSIWRWFDFFPVESRSSIVSLGEGSTPLIPAKRLGEKLGIANLYLKNDTVLPTGSLKDRSNSVGMSVGKELGFATASVISTGNAAASVAAYAAAAGMNSVVMVPKGTANSKIIQAHAYGSTVIVVDGRFDYEVAELYKNAVKRIRLVRLCFLQSLPGWQEELCLRTGRPIGWHACGLGDSSDRRRHRVGLHVAGFQRIPGFRLDRSRAQTGRGAKRGGGAVRRGDG